MTAEARQLQTRIYQSQTARLAPYGQRQADLDNPVANDWSRACPADLDNPVASDWSQACHDDLDCLADPLADQQNDPGAPHPLR